MQDPNVARLLWAPLTGGGDGPRYPVYQVSATAGDLLAEVNSLEKLADAIGVRKGRPPAVRHGAFTRVTISVRTKQMNERSTVARVRRRILAELSMRTDLSEDLSESELAERLHYLEGQMASETPFVRRRVAALTKLAHRHPNEVLHLRYPQQDYRAYLASSGGVQVAMRVNGLLLATDLRNVIEVSPPDTRQRAERKDRLGTRPSFQLRRTDYFFPEDWEASKRA